MNNFIQILHIASNQFLDLFEDTEINLELVNDLFAEELNSQTFSYQFKIASTENNEKIFSFPTIPQVQNSLNEHVPVILYLGGLPYKTGKLINVNNVGDSIDNYMEFGFVGDKANIDLTKNIRDIFSQSFQLKYKNENIIMIRFDLPHFTVQEMNANGQATAGLNPTYGKLKQYLMTFTDSVGTTYNISTATSDYADQGIQNLVDQINASPLNSYITASWTPNYVKDNRVSGGNVYGRVFDGKVHVLTIFNVNFEFYSGVIYLIPKPASTRKITVTNAYRKIGLHYEDFSNTLGDIFNEIHAPTSVDQPVPFYNYAYRTLFSDFADDLIDTNWVVFPTLKALNIDENLSTSETDVFDVYGGENHLFPIIGDKYDPTKTYKKSVSTGQLRDVTYVEFNDPIEYYKTTDTDDVAINEDPYTTPSKWIRIEDVKREKFINKWSNAGTTLDFDNRIYIKNQFESTMVPCLYLWRVLEWIFSVYNIEIVGSLINDTEFQKLIIVPNTTLDDSLSTENKKATVEERKLPTPKNIYYWNNYKTHLLLNEYLPDMSVSDFLTALRNYMGINYIFKDKTVEIVWMQTVLSDVNSKEMSPSTVRGIQLYKDPYYGIVFKSEKDSNDNSFDAFPPGSDFFGKQYEVTDKERAKTISTPIQSFVMVDSNDGYLTDSGSSYQIPLFGNKVTSKSYGSSESMNLRLLIYNGKQLTNYADYATSNKYGPNRSTVLNQDNLSWDWLESKYWAKWEKFFSKQKFIKHRFIPSLLDVLNFDFKQKIRVQDRNHMVKKVQIPIKMTGIDEIQKELYSVE